MTQHLHNDFADPSASVRCPRRYAKAIDKVHGEVSPAGRDALALVRREALDVAGGIVRWNDRMLMAVWKPAPALAIGNSVVPKRCEMSSLSPLPFGERAVEAGLLQGVRNVVPGFGQEDDEVMVRHPDVDAIGFTGSTRIGRRMPKCAAESDLKRVYNELGGKSALSIFPDCPDLRRAAQALAGPLADNTGPSCDAPSRIPLHEQVADEFSSRRVAEASRRQPGDPLLESAAMGAIVDEGPLRRVPAHVRTGTDDAGLPAGGCRAQGCGAAATSSPRSSPRCRPARPTPARRSSARWPLGWSCRGEARVVALADGSGYGLQAGGWTIGTRRAHRVARALRAGSVHVSKHDDADIAVPFGGCKDSGHGRDKSLHATDRYIGLKTTWIRIDD